MFCKSSTTSEMRFTRGFLRYHGRRSLRDDSSLDWGDLAPAIRVPVEARGPSKCECNSTPPPTGAASIRAQPPIRPGRSPNGPKVLNQLPFWCSVDAKPQLTVLQAIDWLGRFRVTGTRFSPRP